VEGHPTLEARESLRHTSAIAFDELFARSEQEAQAGAKIIVWPEQSAGVIILEEDKPALLARTAAFTQKAGVYLDLGVTVILQQPVQSHFFTDESILVDPAGKVAWDYEKAHPVRGVELAYPGERTVPTVQTPYGRLANVICYDADFPGLVRQAGQARADILLVPGNDWKEIDPYHTQVTALRAIETGASLVRPTSQGLSMVVDYEGNVLSAADYFTNDTQVVAAYVPVHGVRTVYAVIGDLFAWLCMVALVVLVGVAIARRQTTHQAGVTEPSPTPLPVA
jgi:apolipoprotein N-acyltransferase